MRKIKVIILAVILVIFPQFVFAQQVCKKDGYTISAINGVFTDEEGARNNQRALFLELGSEYHGEKLDYQYLLNPSHLSGIGDLAMSVVQKVFESETVSDYDLIEMIKDASAKVQTQKLLLVAHSQGNFYANSFYDTVADKEGGVPAQSIAIYSVANPASRVAGNGKWMTSDTDHVIAGLVQHLAFFRKIMPTNEHIAEVAGGLDPSSGHDLTTVYLKYRSTEIVKGIQESLDKLAVDPGRSESALCIDPPKLSLAHKIEGAVLAVADPVATAGVTTVATTAKVGFFVVATTVKAGITATVWTYHTGVAVVSWTYNSTIALGKAVGDGAITLGSNAYSLITSAFTNKSIAANNTAAVILATQSQQSLQNPQSPAIPSSFTNNKISPPIINTAVSLGQPSTQSNPTVIVFNLQATSTPSSHAPKLVFVGSFNGGVAQQILGLTNVGATVAKEEAPAEIAVLIDATRSALAAPEISVPQCAQTLATDGCLLATTTVHFDWAPVTGATYYEVNKNGTNATTTETSAEVTVKDFSDYSLSVVAVGDDVEKSATSTQVVSVATIPIAINEIAWMGTAASSTGEWFELKNNTGNTIDLSQWEMNAKDGTPHVKLSGTIAPHAYLVFERISDKTISDVSAHQIYTGALGNSGEQLKLSHASTTLDQTPDIVSSTWAAGYNSTSSKQTMERYSSKEAGADPTNWGDNLVFISNGVDAGGNAIDGTPGEKNSVSYLINKGQDIMSDTTLSPDDGPYVTMGTTVAASTTLTLEPGVEIKFYEGGKLFIEGSLNATGTPENPVILRSFNDNVSGGVIVWSGTGTTTVSNTLIENTSGIEVYGASSTLEISNTKFDGNEIAVELYSGAHATIASSTIANTFDGDAVGVYNRSAVMIASTTIDGISDGSGVSVYDGILLVSNSTIKNASDSGITLANSTSTISNVNIENGGYSGVDIYKSATTINDTTISGFSGGAGVSVDAIGESVSITGGEITENGIGVLMNTDSVVLTNVSIHDNGVGPEDNIVVQ